MKRTSYCGEIRESHIGKKMILCGWVHRRRDHGGLIFIDLRDREGIAQIVFSPEISDEIHKKAHRLHAEEVIEIEGIVTKRPEETDNDSLPTGHVEIYAERLEILNTAETPAFRIEDECDAGEEIRLRHRHLDLRRPPMLKTLQLRHKVCKTARDYLDEKGFLEVETPILTKPTPEGARDYLVPSRVYPGSCFALPQSPQLFKQILMIAGLDRYFQIARCFRDEDLRADRQPEFTQIDMEMSFIEPKDCIEIAEGMIKEIFQTAGIPITLPFPAMSYQDAMENYGSDRPDLRFKIPLVDVGEIVKASQFQVFLRALEKDGIVKGIAVPPLKDGKEAFSRKDIDELTDFVGQFGARGLAWFRVKENGLDSSIKKFFPDEVCQGLQNAFQAKPGSLLFFGADKAEIVHEALGQLRVEIARRRPEFLDDQKHFVWILDFPLFQKDRQGNPTSVHHPFTAPCVDDIKAIEQDPFHVQSKAYDLVLNGMELGGGSIRIHRYDTQMAILKLLGFDEAEAQRRFGFLLDALKSGAPPHGGIAFGLDRIISILSGAASIRDVIAFPKTQRAQCLLTDAPGAPGDEQWQELGLNPIVST